MSATKHDSTSDPFEFSCGIVHIYARFLVLRCYEDYNLRHDTQPVYLYGSDRVGSGGHDYILAMQHRRLELVKLKQDLFGYLGPLTPTQNSIAIREDSCSADVPYEQQLRSLLTDVEMLLTLYDNTVRIYEWHIHETDSGNMDELASAIGTSRIRRF